MGREVRMVPKGWKHPKNEKGNFIPLMGGGPYSERVRRGWVSAPTESTSLATKMRHSNELHP